LWGALVLAGGKSQRMKENKILTKLGDKPLLLHVTDKIRGMTNEVVVVVGKNDEIEKYAAILPSPVTIIKDSVEGKGPLMGILSGMQKMCSEYAVVLPCDSPFIKKEVLEHLFDKAQGADAVIPRWPNGNIEPLHAIYKISSTISAAKAAIKADELLILDMIKRLKKVVYLNTSNLRKFDKDLVTFFNINRQEDLRKATDIINSRI
jgi:molybdopterin-guanine dinucleotide biosynthesis protein A